MFTISDFLDSYPRFNTICSNFRSQDILSQLTEPENIHKMIVASHLGRPALEALVVDLESDFSTLTPSVKALFDYNNITERQAVGSMIQYVLKDFGYLKDGSKSLKKRPNAIFKTAATYSKDSHANAKYTITISINRL